MPEQNIALWGWEAATNTWHKIAVTAAGLLRIDLTAISLGDLGDVDLAGIAANDIIYWNAVAGEWQPIAMWVAAHAASHELGGADVIDVGGLSGQLADDQHVKDAEVLLVAAALLHAARHELGGADVINVAGLSGQLADDQHVKDAEVLAVAAALLHEATHRSGGADAIAGALNIAAMANLTSTMIWQGNVANRPVEVAMPAAGPSFVAGSYVGNGVDDRQIATGFLCKCVLILNQGTTSVDFFPVLNPTGADTLDIRDTDSVDDRDKPYLHATDGFVLGNAASEANGGGDDYKYVAFG